MTVTSFLIPDWTVPMIVQTPVLVYKLQTNGHEMWAVDCVVTPGLDWSNIWYISPHETSPSQNLTGTAIYSSESWYKPEKKLLDMKDIIASIKCVTLFHHLVTQLLLTGLTKVTMIIGPRGVRNIAFFNAWLRYSRIIFWKNWSKTSTIYVYCLGTKYRQV